MLNIRVVVIMAVVITAVVITVEVDNTNGPMPKKPNGKRNIQLVNSNHAKQETQFLRVIIPVIIILANGLLNKERNGKLNTHKVQ